MPEAASPGIATVIVQPPQGPSVSQAVRISPSAPGLYLDPVIGGPKGYFYDAEGNVFSLLTCLSQGSCFATHIPLSTTPGGLDFVLYGTGLRLASGLVTLYVGTHALDSVAVVPDSEIAGVDCLRFHLPQEFPLHLYQTLSV